MIGRLRAVNRNHIGKPQKQSPRLANIIMAVLAHREFQDALGAPNNRSGFQNQEKVTTGQQGYTNNLEKQVPL